MADSGKGKHELLNTTPIHDLLQWYDNIVENRRAIPTEFESRQTLIPAISRLEQIRYYKQRIGKQNDLREDKFFASGYINMTNYSNKNLYYDLLEEIHKLYSDKTTREIIQILQISNTTLRKIINGDCRDEPSFMLAILCKINPQYNKKLPEKISGSIKT